MISKKIGGEYFMKLLDRLALTILILAGIHLVVAGLLDYNVIEMIFGTTDSLGAQITYGVIGVSALWCLKYYSYTPEGGSRLRGR
jgi:hypothetical protein